MEKSSVRFTHPPEGAEAWPNPALALVERLAEDMVLRWRQGQRPPAEDYFSRHPELWQAPEAALELIAEEISLRQEDGQPPSEADLVRRFPQWRQQIRTLLDCHQMMTAGPPPMRFPAPGESLGEFDLLAEIGRGSHARVFLARQRSLADRLVVLKVGPRAGREHLSLARLQHTHIVPLYSAHDFAGRGLRAMCLPYFGGATLEQLLAALRARPAGPISGRDVLEALREIQADAPVSVGVEGPACRFLARASFVQVVCWLGGCLADALQYAHDRGLAHLDLKPSNVLLAADGQPMLLDFHLARGPLAAGAPRPVWLGGTPGYMAPEQQAALRAVVDGRPIPVAVDGRADVYALGRLLCELLGEAPPREGEALPAMLPRRHPGVTRSLADLLDCCLASNPTDRYPTAADLAGDLRRHLGNLPLRGVRNRSPIERWRKWRRRRPYTLPLLLLGLLLFGAGGFSVAHVRRQMNRVDAVLREGQDHLEHQRYAEALEAFRHGSALAGDLPFSAGLDREMRRHVQLAERAGAASELHRFCERVRPLYGVDQLPVAQMRAIAGHCRTMWDQRESIHCRLEMQPDPELSNQVRADLLDLAILNAHFRVRLSEEAAARKEALAVLTQAEELLGASCVLYRERQTHALALGLHDLAREARRRGAETAPRSAWEHYALGRAHFVAGDLEAAQREMDLALEQQPQSLWPTFHKGCCAYRLGQYDDAVVAFSICLVLAPRSAWCAYNRGLAYAEIGRLDQALRDHDRALRLDPQFAAAALSRGVLHYRAKRFAQALEDLNRARRDGLDTAAVHCSLALVHLAREDRPAALASVREALRREPEHRQARELLLRLGEER